MTVTFVVPDPAEPGHAVANANGGTPWIRVGGFGCGEADEADAQGISVSSKDLLAAQEAALAAAG